MKRFPKSKRTKIKDSTVEAWFANCADVTIERLVRKPSVMLIFCEPLIDGKELRNKIIPYLEELEYDHMDEGVSLIATHSIAIDDKLQNHLMAQIFEGKLIVIIENRSIFAIDINSIPHRSIDQAVTELSIKGARDGFVEELTTNLGLIRKRIKTMSLKIQWFTLGKKNKTKVALLYIEDAISPKIIKDISSRIEKVDVDSIQSSTQLEELIQSKRLLFFPLVDYTGRPDYASNCLMQGRFIILVDGSPTAIIGPVSLPFLINSAEDQHVMTFTGSMSRIIRFISLFIASFMPGLYIALITHHPDQLPYSLLATFTITRKGIPFPSSLEGFLIILLFELLREAGLRLPTAYGQTLSIVGGLIIGQAVINAGIASPGIIVVVAISIISTFTLVNQQLASTISMIRIANFFISSLLGLAGFFLSAIFVIVHVANLRSFHTPYLASFSPIRNKKENMQFFFHDTRQPQKHSTQSQTKNSSRE